MVTSLVSIAALTALLPAQNAPEQSPDRPAACSGSAMAFDRARERLVLFDGGGGPDCVDPRRITWEHDGEAWAKALEGEGPSPRYFHAMVYDEARQVVLLFGGICRDRRDPCGDAWIWDGAGWSEIPVDGPGARYGVVLSYDPDRERVLLFGGRDDVGPFRDLWSWDGEVWTREWTGQTGL